MQTLGRLGRGLLVPWLLCAQFSMDQPVGLVAVTGAASPVLYATVGGFLFRSTDDGLSWSPLYLRASGGPQPLLHALAVDPGDPLTIYAGAEWSDGGLWKSTDGGATWKISNHGMTAGGGVVDYIRIRSGSPPAILAKAGNQLFKSTDGGANWRLQSTLPDNAPVFAESPGDPALMFAGRLNTIYRSEDEGATWTNAAGLTIAAGTVITGLAVDPRDPNTVYAATAGSGAGFGVFVSTDRGAVWNRRLANQALGIFAHPTLGLLYAPIAGTACLAVSGNRGLSWATSCQDTAKAFIHLGFDPRTPERILAATVAGVFLSQTAGRDWLPRRGSVKPTLQASPEPLRFILPPGGIGSLGFPLRILESSRWAATVETSVNQPWLSLNDRQFTTPANALLRVSAASLAPGDYNATVRMESPRVFNSPAEIQVLLQVRPAPAQGGYLIATYAGNGQQGNTGDGGQASLATLGPLHSLALDSRGRLYLSDSGNNVIRRIDPDRTIHRHAGTGRYGFEGDGGAALLAAFRSPGGLAVDGADNLFIGDVFNQRIRRIDAGGALNTFASDWTDLGGMAFDGAGFLYVADRNSHRVLRVSPAGQVSLFAGTGVAGFHPDGVEARQARLNLPSDVAVDGAGTVYIADTGNHRIRAVGKDGRIRTVAGSGFPGFQGDGGQAVQLALNRPTGLAVDGAGNIYIADTDNHRIRMVDARGVMTTIAGTGEAGFGGDGGDANLARLRSPVDVVAAADGAIFIADALNYRIRVLRQAPSSLPAVPAGGMVNAASGAPRLAPGSLFSLYGSRLASATKQAAGAPWPLTLAGATVRINGVAAPLYYASPGQINGQVPWEISLGEASATVTVNGQTSLPVTFPVAPAAPGILVYGEGRAVAQNPDGAINGPSHPVSPGSVLVVYLTGQGPLDGTAVTGAAAPGDPLLRATLPVTATLGDQPATVLFLGLSPGFVGLAQANVLIPALQPGEYQLVIRAGQEASNPVKVVIGGSPPAP